MGAYETLLNRPKDSDFVRVVDAAVMLMNYPEPDRQWMELPSLVRDTYMLAAGQEFIFEQLGSTQTREFVDGGEACTELVGPAESNDYRDADISCSIAALWRAARVKGNISLIQLIERSEAERKRLALSYFDPEREGGFGIAPNPVAVLEPIEAPAARRARLLSWREEEEAARGKRGALERVTVREKVCRPMADRSNIGKDIKRALEERAEKKRSGALLGSLGVSD